MRFLGIDLASRCSAYVLLDSEGHVLEQGDSYGISEWDFVDKIKEAGEIFSSFGPESRYFVNIVIEDLPHRVPFRVSVKEVLRLQGRLIHEIDGYGELDRVFWLPPAVWQRSYDGVWRKGVAGAREAAASLGYEPPDLLSDDVRFPYKELKGKERTKIREAAKKLMTDYVDAYLIAEWARRTHIEHGTLLVKGVQETFWRASA